MGTRKRAVLALDYNIVGDDDAMVGAVKHMIDSIDTLVLMESLLDAIGKGVSVVEIIWDYTATAWMPAKFQWLDPRLFIFDQDTGRQMLIRTESQPTGEWMDPRKYIVHRPYLKSGRPCRDGVARSAIWAWMSKNYTLHDWVSFCEKFGVPLRIGKYDASASTEDRKTLLKALRNLGHDAAAMMPQSMDITFESPSNPGNNAGVFEAFAKYIDAQVSKLILGQPLPLYLRIFKTPYRRRWKTALRLPISKKRSCPPSKIGVGFKE